MNILLADPDRDLLLCYTRLLEQEGHAVATAFDAAELFRLWDEAPRELVILDADLPRLSREKLAEKAAADRTPLLILGTGRSAPAFPGGGTFPYLAFPFFPDDLLRRTAELLPRKTAAQTEEAAQPEGPALPKETDEVTEDE